MVPWRCELRGATVLRRSGWSPEMFKAGTTITITGAPDRFEPNTCYLGSALFADGTRVDRYGQLSRPALPRRSSVRCDTPAAPRTLPAIGRASSAS